MTFRIVFQEYEREDGVPLAKALRSRRDRLRQASDRFYSARCSPTVPRGRSRIS
jgi:hypothetical protein